MIPSQIPSILFSSKKSLKILTFGSETKILYLSCTWHQFSVDIELTTSSCDEMTVLEIKHKIL